MIKPTYSFDQVPEQLYKLGLKVDNLTALLSQFSVTSPIDEVGGIDLAIQVTRLSKPRIYALVSARLIPHKKRGNRLTFRCSELLNWLDEGNRQMKGELDA